MRQPTKVLLVDDDAGFLHATSLMLKDAGFDVVTAQDAQSGLAALLEHRPDVAVIDVIMNRPDEGFVLARAIRAERMLADVKVLVLTAAGERYQMAFEPDEQWLPVDRVLEKPIEAERLIAEIARAAAGPGPKE
jgi:CheY-like chemotaxis protein